MGSQHSIGEYLRVFALSNDPVLTAVEVGEMVGVSQQAAHSRLTSLERDGYVESKKVGGRARVYWLTDQGRDQIAAEFLEE